MPYEKVGKNEPVCIANEVPFDIPESWKWARISTIFTLQAGKNIQASDISESDFDGSYLCYGGNGVRGFVKSYNREGNYPIIGRQGALCGNIKYAKGKFYATEHAVCVETFAQTNVEWACAFLEALNLNQYATATAQPGLAVANINTILIPVPPKNEQQRIIDMLISLQPSISSYTKKECELNSLNQQFSDLLKKSILQEAVQGKLVPQDSNDEPASILLEHIRAEKEQLIKAGKIKRDKHESVIFRRDNSHYEKLDGIESCIDDEIPFDIPDSWEWIRMGSLLAVNPRNAISDDTIVGFMPMPLLHDGFSNSHTFEERQWKDIKSGFTHFADNDVVIAKITPCFQNRKSAVICDLPNGYGAGTTELHVLRDYTKILYMPYFLLLCKTHAFIQDGMKNFTGTAGQQRVGKDFISNYLVPLPPVEEQKRIVQRANFVIESCDIL